MVLKKDKEAPDQDGECIDHKTAQYDVSFGQQLGSDINVSGFKLLFAEREPTIRR